MALHNKFRDLLGRATQSAPVKNQHQALDKAANSAKQSFSVMAPGLVVRLLEATLRADQTPSLLEAYSKIHNQKDAFTQFVIQRYETRLALAINEFQDQREAMQKPVTTIPEELSLMETAEMDRLVLARNLAGRLQNKHGDILFDLAARLATLAGVAEVPSNANPFKPALMIEALDEAWQHIREKSDSETVVLECTTPEVIGDLTLIYQNIVAVFEEAGIQPTRPTILTSQKSSRQKTLDNESKNQHEEDAAATQHSASFAERLQQLAESGASHHTLTNADTNSFSASHSHQQALPISVLTQLLARLPIGGNDSAAQNSAAHSSAIALPDSAPANAFVAPNALNQLPVINNEALAQLVPSSEMPRAVSALNYLQSAQINNPETFRQALMPSFGAAVDTENLGYVDPLSPIDAALNTPVKFVNLVRSIQQSDIGKNANQVDSVIIELVARVFDFVFDDRNLPDAIKVLLSRLQIPLLKAAMLNAQFFQQEEHPARKLINVLASAGLGWEESDGRDDPLFALIEQSVEKVITDFKEDVSFLEKLAGQVAQKIQQIEEETRAATAPQLNEAQQIAGNNENQELASRVAQQAIEERLNDRQTLNFAADFLRNAWTNYLQELLLKESNDSAKLANGMATVDDLLWSIEPKLEPLERARMLAKTPFIERQLKSGLKRIEWDAYLSHNFFTALDDRWAGAVIGEPMVVEPPTPEALAHHAEVLAEEKELPNEILNLQTGDLLEITKDDGAVIRYKLGWISAEKTRFLLTNRLNSAPLIVTADHLFSRWLEKKLRILDKAPLMDRALNNILNALEETRYPKEMMMQTGAY